MLPHAPLTETIAAYESELDQLPVLSALGLRHELVVEPLPYKLFDAYGVQVDLVRADQLHPVISGNKWYKLKYNLLEAQRQGCHELLSFGGVWSNHLHALACLAAALKMSAVGVVRGEEHDVATNPMLLEAARQGMTFEFVSRQRFRQLRDDPFAMASVGRYLIPEGGDNPLGVLGAASMVHCLRCDVSRYTHGAVAVGTGCTYAGLRLGLPSQVKLLGVSALKGAWMQRAIAEKMTQLNVPEASWLLSTQHHRGGFAAVDESLLSFISEFRDNTGVALEPVYTGKAMLALIDFIQQQIIPGGSRVLFIHSGGLQGLRGFKPPLKPNPDIPDE